MLKYAEDEKPKIDEIERPESPSYYDELAKEVEWYHKILLNRPLKVAIVMLLLSTLTPCLIYLYLYQDNLYVANVSKDGYSIGTCFYESTDRLSCGSPGITKEECPSNCCYDENLDFCYHYYPARFSYVFKGPWSEDTIMKPRFQESPYNSTKNVNGLKLKVDEISKTHLRFSILKNNSSKSDQDFESARLESKSETEYEYSVSSPEFHIDISRKNSSKPLISTSKGPLIATEEMMEISLFLSGNITSGLGNLNVTEKHLNVLYNTKGEDFSAPAFFGFSEQTFFGLFVENSEPMEIKILPGGIINIKAFWAKQLDFQFYVGDYPAAVFSQFMEYKGKVQELPAWVVGAHFCRESTGNKTTDLSNFEKFSLAADSEMLPYESDCIVEDIQAYLNSHSGNSLDKLNIIEDSLQTLQEYSKLFIPVLKPQILFNNSDPVFLEALESGTLILDYAGNEPLVREVKGDWVSYPDYSSANVSEWLKNNWKMPENITSFVLRDNWPEGDENERDCNVDLKYATKDMKEKFCRSIPWNAINPDGNAHYSNHNTYGDNHAKAIEKLISTLNNNSKTFIWSSNLWSKTNAGKNHQEIPLSWSGMAKAFSSAVQGSVEGLIFQGIPVCGDLKSDLEAEEAEHLCLRWYAASFLFPIFRIESTNGDPFSYSVFTKGFMIKLVQSRYKLLSYIHTVLSQNKPLLRPMYFEFYDDEETFTLETQFMVGGAVLMAPIFEPWVYSVPVYIPENETFYELWGGQEIRRNEDGWVQIPSLEIEVPTLMRAGHIIPVHEEVHKTAEMTRKSSNITLLIALKCEEIPDTNNKSCQAKGSLYAGDLLSFSATQDNIVIDPNLKNTRKSLCEDKDLSDIVKEAKIYGLVKGQVYVKSIGVSLCSLDDGDILQISLS